MIKEIHFGEPRGFPLPKYTADRVREMNIPRCVLCGSRTREHSEQVCPTCLRLNGTVVADKE